MDYPRINETVCLIGCIVVIILIHHIIIHKDIPFPSRIFQIKDVMNHETWALVLSFFGLGLVVSKYFERS